MFDFEKLKTLCDDKPINDVACPLCGPHCKTPSNRKRETLRVWRQREDFITYKCQRCGEKGYAHANNHGSAKSAFDQAVDMVSIFKPAKSLTFKEPEPDKDKLALLRNLWRRSLPARGTIVETYLKGRKCWLDTETVRLLPARGDHLPAMIVPFGIPTEIEPGVLDITGADIFGIQLTKLKPDGSGKAAVEPNKMTLGQCMGYPIVLAAPNETLALVIAEGVEEALSSHIVSGRGAWAAGGASRMPALADKVPDYIESVTILVDDNEAGLKGSNSLAFRLHKRGVKDIQMVYAEVRHVA